MKHMSTAPAEHRPPTPGEAPTPGRLLLTGAVGLGLIALVTQPVYGALAGLPLAQRLSLPAYATHGVMLAGALIILWLARFPRPRLRLAPALSRRFLATAACCAALALLSGWRFPAFSASYLQAGPAALLSRLVFELLVVGWTEEYLFRGALQRLFNAGLGGRSLGGLRLGTLLAALLFGLVHLGNIAYQPPALTVIQAVYATLIGLVLGRYYDASDDLAGAAWLHSILDGGAFLVTWLVVAR